MASSGMLNPEIRFRRSSSSLRLDSESNGGCLFQIFNTDKPVSRSTFPYLLCMDLNSCWFFENLIDFNRIFNFWSNLAYNYLRGSSIRNSKRRLVDMVPWNLPKSSVSPSRIFSGLSRSLMRLICSTPTN